MRLMTWNMQGGNKWGDLKSLIMKYEIDVLCLQECGVPPETVIVGAEKDTDTSGTAAITWTIGTASRGRKFGGFYYEFGKSNKRCSLAVLGCNANGMSNLTKVAYKGKKGNLSPDKFRPAIGLQTVSKLWVFSFHAPSSNSGFASACTNSVIEELKGQKDLDNWIIGGDFNCEPDDMKKRIGSTGTICKSGQVTHPGKTQNSDRELDYAIHTNGLNVNCAGAMGVQSDHWPVAFEVQGF